MTAWGVSAALAAAILVVLALRVRAVLRAERGALRGAAPGDGVHVIVSDYQSGTGGGHYREYTVPKDPQAYARLFVPRDKRGRKP
ncbi:hypothetical protein E2L08_01280 [Palleronia sediminis]|uniref:Uncharacterized protein n=1 Tax=Palleronia sediminis TaxID=2547833 RepID=A0A4R6ALB4_9RHOB|nr:hypothetical protein [Palleronia sediminis]TDL84132.1 hypothetical protein E2L08_01280 [Palleronia sediminis]